MRNMLIAVPFCALVAAGAAQAEPLSRAEAVAAALRANPVVQRSREEKARLEGLVVSARAEALPELTLNLSGLRYRDPSLLNSSSFDSFPPELRDLLKPVPANIYEGIAQIRQTLFSFRVGAAIRAARLGAKYGQEEVRRAQQSIALLAITSYNDYLLALERVRVADNSTGQKEKHLETARNRRVAGVATDLDVLRSQVDLENQRAALLREKGRSQIARARLNAVMVRPIDGAIEPTDTLAFAPLDVPLDEVIREAWANRPEAKAVALAVDIRRELVKIARAGSRPTLEFNGAYGYSVRETKNFFDSDYTRWSLGINLRVPLFDGLKTAGQVAQAKAELNQTIQDRVALENDIHLEASEAVDRLSVAKSVLEVAELNVTQAQRALEMVQANYNHGAATLLDVLDAQAALNIAESNRAEALHAHSSARAMLYFTMARDPLDAPQGARQ